MFRILIKFIVFIVEKVIAAFALVAAFVSMAEGGGLLERMLGSLVTLYGTFHGFVVAYAGNEQFRAAWSRFTAAFDRGLEAAAKNIEADPHTVLFVFIATIVGFKFTAWFMKLIRKNLLSRGRARPMKPPTEGRRPTPGAKSATYGRLYEPPEISPSTSAHLGHSRGPRVPASERREE